MFSMSWLLIISQYHQWKLLLKAGDCLSEYVCVWLRWVFLWNLSFVIPWWCVGQCNLSFPVSPFNTVFKAVRRGGLNVALVQDFGFSYQRLLVSSGVGFACLHRAAEEGPCKRLICTGGLQPSTTRQIGHLWAKGLPGAKCLQPSRLPSKVYFTADSPSF